jgi:cysteine desulfuration protein SufE
LNAERSDWSEPGERRLPADLADLSELVATLAALDRSERIDMLISLAEGFREVPESIARRPFPESQRVPACESQAFVFSSPREDGRLDFHFAVENPQGLSAKAFAAVLARTLSGQAPASVLAVPIDIVDEVFG